MKNKKVLIALIAVLIIIIAAVATLIIVKPFDSNKNDEEEKETSGSYEDTLNKFIKACKDEDDMEKFVEKYVDYKSVYVLINTLSVDDLEEEWKDADEDDYMDEDFIDDVKDTYKQFAGTGEKLKISKVKENRKFDVKIKDWVMVEFKIEVDDEKLDYGAVFCKDKLVFVGSMDNWEDIFSGRDDYSYGDDDDNDDDNDDDDVDIIDVAVAKDDADEYNEVFQKYEDYEAVSGKEILELIDEVIDSNEKNAGEEGKYIMLSANDTEYNPIDEDLYDVVFDAYIENTAANVKKANKELENLKSLINKTKRYSVSKYTDLTTGYIYQIFINEQE